MTTPEEARLKRLRMRAWRRGTKEMDLVLGNYCDLHLAKLSLPELDALEALMDEQDQDLMAWLMGQAAPPEKHRELLAILEAFARQHLRVE